MFVNYDSLPDNAKVWIYPSSRKFYPKEIDTLHQQVQNFITNWKSDDINFKASYQLKYNRFIIFITDDPLSTLTNTDIDAQVQFIFQLQNEYHLELLDKMNVCFKQGEYVQYKELKDFKKLLKNKAISAKTIVFDNLVNTKKELEDYWEVPITESWYQRFLK